MELGLLQQQTTKLVMTQELRQAIALLQFSHQELIDFIREEELNNPLIEVRESFVERLPVVSPSRSPQPFYDHEGICAPMTLKNDLYQQTRCLHISSDLRERVFYLIDALDEDGYLPKTILPQMAAEYGISEQAAQESLDVLRQLEPPGVGARSLIECLQLQLQRSHPDNDLALTIIEHELPLLGERKWQQLADRCDSSLDAVKEAAQVIRSLVPKPGAAYQQYEPHYVRPDLLVKRNEDRFVVTLYGDMSSYVRLNHHYRSLLKGSPNEAYSYVRRKYQRLLWLQKSIEQRTTTLLRVGESIIRRQHKFLEKGTSALAPMTLRDVAEDLGIHESTVSRAVRNKWMQTPYGLRELKSFFPSKVASRQGETSSSQVKALMRTMILAEDLTRPLSDRQIADELRDRHGIELARRTVAKYREQLHIPPSAKRQSYRKEKG
ncbi:MAG TPA: RNA polymerase factor sigma-54 [Bacillales bacterium]|nr:RNA polymerase factor sigma-54 [Bacillales bacterium]